MLLDHVPVEGEIVYAPSFHVRGYTKITGGANAEHDKTLFEKGLLFPTIEDALVATSRLYEILEEEKQRVLEAHERSILALCENESQSQDESCDYQPNANEPSGNDVSEVKSTGMFSSRRRRRARRTDSPSPPEPDIEEAENNESLDDFVLLDEEPLDDEANARLVSAYEQCAKLFDIGDEIVVRGTPYSAATRVAGGVLVDRVEQAREDFILFTERKLGRDKSAETFVRLVNNIPKDARAKILAIMGARPFAEMMAGFCNSALEMEANK